MYKSAYFILDLHFGKKCNTRLDDTDDVLYEKLLKILDDCIDKDNHLVFIAGDIFDSCSISRKSFMKALKIFKEYKEANIDVFAIYGNHDEYRYNSNLRKETPLNDLVELCYIQILDGWSIFFGDKVKYRVTGHSYLNNEITETIKRGYLEGQTKTDYLDNYNYKDIVIGHWFYDNEFMGGDKNLPKKLIEKSNADYIILGHDHSYYDPVTIGETTVFRFGSLLRGTGSFNDLHRPVGYLEINDDGPIFRELEVPELKDVTIAKATIKEEKKDFISMIEEITMEEKEEETDNVLDSINKLENENVKNIIKKHI